MPRRKRDEDADETDATPRKARRRAQDDSPTARGATTPANRKSILRGTPSKTNGTPSSLRKVLFLENDADGDAYEAEERTPTSLRNDRSARRKSSKALSNQHLKDSEDEENDGELALANAILDEADEAASEDEVKDAINGTPHHDQTLAANAPTKRGRGRPRGRPRKERTPSPPPNMPPHELYFFQNRTGANKTSSNTLPPHTLLNHEDYLANIKAFQDPHQDDLKRLRELHHRGFDQWIFELEQGFNICLYGYGSKRDLAMDFADHLYHASPKPPNMVIVNGYTPGLTIRDVLATVASITISKSTKLPAQPSALLDLLLSHPPTTPIFLIIHSVDAPPLRKFHSLLARLVSHPFVSLIATVDTPTFPLLWSSTHLRAFNWLYHDTTTFSPYRVEIDVVEDVNILLGKSGRGVKGREGVAFVLRSLPENARSLFRILVVEQLSSMAEGEGGIIGAVGEEDDESILGASDEEDAAAETPTRKRGRGRPPKNATPKRKKVPIATAVGGSGNEGVEYRTLYHKAVEEFVCSSELNFRTLLKEFHDHQMVESRKDGLGVERLYVPGISRDELEGVLEELV